MRLNTYYEEKDGNNAVTRKENVTSSSYVLSTDSIEESDFDSEEEAAIIEVLGNPEDFQ